MKVAFFTLGCKVNQYDTQLCMELLSNDGFEVVQPKESADVYVVNSCTVTAESDRKTRQTVRSFKRKHPQSIVVLTGCLPQVYPEIAEDLPEADIVIGNSNYPDLPRLLNEHSLTRQHLSNIIPHELCHDTILSDCGISAFQERTRAAVKIQEGCDNYCSYCIIPTARGPVRSKDLEKVKAEINALETAGFNEIVFVGINLTTFGRESSYSLTDAVELASSFDGISRIRLGSLEPDRMTEGLIEQLSKYPKLCPHFHLSLQSGCDKTLKRMNRKYTTVMYESLCQTLRSTFPDCSLTTDVIAGFPGEAREEFDESLAFVNRIGFAKVHVFPYSPRPGTKAAEMPNQISKKEKEERSRKMLAAAQSMRDNFLKNQVGKTVIILAEEATATKDTVGFTPNYTPVIIKGKELEKGKFFKVLLTAVAGDCCEGKTLQTDAEQQN